MPNLLKTIGRYVGFGYDAVKNNGKRKAAAPLLQSEDSELPPVKRDAAVTDNRDVVRNFAMASWAVRCHLNYVTNFSFQAKTGNEALDARLEEVIEECSKPENFDIAGRHGRARGFRLSEARRTIDGDVGHIKISSGHMQFLEGDRIRDPAKLPDGVLKENLSHGVQVSKAGAAVAYAVHRRGLANRVFGGSQGFTFERMIAARNLYLHAHYERFDQTRGISPLESAINTYKDIYEGFDYALAKIKISQLFGLAITREAAEGVGAVYEPVLDEEGNPTGRYQVDFGTGPVLLELDPGDKAEFLSCATPATDTQQFFEAMIAVALKCLDIPFSFWNESFTNYTGSRGAYLQYEQAALAKRDDVKAAHLDWSRWRLGLAIQDGMFADFPGITVDDLKHDWLHRGQKWLDPFKEIQAESRSVDELSDNSEDIAQSHGKNFYENVDKQAKCIAYAKKKGVPFRLAAGLQMVLPDEEKPGKKENSDDEDRKQTPARK